MRALRVGTRGSALALWQANAVSTLLRDRGCTVDVTIIRTAGDRLQETPGDPSPGKGVFVKEIEEALLAGTIDLAVHSAKDMSATLPDGLSIGAVLQREDPRDALVLRDAPVGLMLTGALGRIRSKPAIGTSSVRRAAQLTAVIRGAHFTPIRGNVDTRLKKLDAGEFDAIVLAVAGMKRLGFGARVTAPISIDQCIPAPGQGIVAIETRTDDDELRRVLATIGDASAAASFEAERALVTALGGGCQLPLGGIAIHEGSELAMQAVVISSDGERVLKSSARGSFARPAELGRRVADDL
ncbi:MAG TPA: hydroxymethylbilane synthase, partial [Vicinamibacterales bacterium]